ncbi:MAG: site-specific integrase [Gammaproteobacteria bacterium]|nr:site-specific integrase [Gammaproteobacteria bacterium]
MRKHHPENERVKRRYLQFLREAKRLSEPTVDHAAAAVAAFEESTGYRDFRRFHIEQAQRFKRVLDEHVCPANGKPLARATIHSRLIAMKAFLLWLADQPGYRSRIRYSDAEYFNPSGKDGRIAKAARERPVPTLEQIRHVLAMMPTKTDIERRDRAIIASTILTGARDNAIASLSLKHIDMEQRTLFQDAREVRTKRAKTIYSHFFPVGEDIEAIVFEWVALLKDRHLFGPDDPLFPATQVALGDTGQFEAVGLSRKHWQNANTIRRIFREAFEAAGLSYFNPHSFRRTLAALGERVCTTPEAFKAWSQNLGHDQVLTTFISYGGVSLRRQGEILEELRSGVAKSDGLRGLDEVALGRAVLSVLRQGKD